MAYSTAALRLLVRQFARNALDSSLYPDAQIDTAIMLAGDEWVRETRTVRKAQTLTLTAGSDALPAFPADFIAERLLQAALLLGSQVINPNLDVVGYENLLAKRNERGHLALAGFTPTLTTTNSRPQRLCFIDQTTGLVDPAPDVVAGGDVYTIQLWYAPPFTTWTAGGVPTPDSFNVPDEHLRQIARFGAPGYLQLGEKANNAFAEEALAQFRAQAKRFKSLGAGGRGAVGTVSVMADPDAHRTGVRGA